MVIKFTFYGDSAKDQVEVTELVYYAVIIALTKFGKMATNEDPEESEIRLLSYFTRLIIFDELLTFFAPLYNLRVLASP